MPTCPQRASSKTVKNGHIYNGKQQFLCHECGRQLIENPVKKLERISLAGIARVVTVSEQLLQTYVNIVSGSIIIVLRQSLDTPPDVGVACRQAYRGGFTHHTHNLD